jgi:hypothetical protein
LVSDFPAGEGKTVNLFLQCKVPLETIACPRHVKVVEGTTDCQEPVTGTVTILFLVQHTVAYTVRVIWFSWLNQRSFNLRNLVINLVITDFVYLCCFR